VGDVCKSSGVFDGLAMPSYGLGFAGSAVCAIAAAPVNAVAKIPAATRFIVIVSATSTTSKAYGESDVFQRANVRRVSNCAMQPTIHAVLVESRLRLKN
jgi:hypothetical protein